MKNNRILRILKNKKGGLTIEALPALALALFVMITAIGWFTYLTPRQNLEKQVHILAQKAKIQGGLTNSGTNNDLSLFLSVLESKGVNKSKVVVTCKTKPSNKNCLGVNGLNSSGTNYIKRNSLEMMVIRVEVPTSPRLLKMSQVFFGGRSSIPDKYIFEESVLSERW